MHPSDSQQDTSRTEGQQTGRVPDVKPLAPPMTAQAASQGMVAPQVPPAQVPDEAADSDVIESGWIAKIKQVLASTRENPNQQVRELNTLKAEYMKKRYDKDLKLPND